MFQEPTTDPIRDSEPAKAPPSGERSIFRSEALQRYIQSQEKAVLPRLVSPQVFVYLWIVAGLLFVTGFAVAFWPVIGRLTMSSP